MNPAPCSISPIPCVLLAAVCLASMSGCDTGLVAADSLVESPTAEAFLDRLSSDCGDYAVGAQPLKYLIDINSDDTYFVDITSKLFFGQVSRQQYASDIDAFYPTNANQPALNCIFSELDDQ